WKISEVAGLPLLMALGGLFLFLATPVTNSISRTAEYQADLFGLNAVRKPDAFASVMLKLSTYRKLEPGRWEEIIFYDHPSGRTRIAAAMRWKKEHIADSDIRDTATLP
ncbi:MAG TPA: M48 family metalloprotease, partial [Rhizomicrobium sp.]|nr:M48 family metalloprotease [Rhizomicrobium sp.]